MISTALLRALALMCGGMALIPVADTAGKLLGMAGVDPFFTAWSRFALGALLVWTAMGGRGFEHRVFTDWRYWLRGSFIAGGVTCMLTALKTAPIADVFAAFFVGPILSYFLSAWLLGERITRARTVLLFIGFCGVIMVVKPGATMALGTLFGLAGGLFYGCYLVATKWLSATVNPRSLLLSHLVTGTLLLAPWGLKAVPDMSASVVALIAVSAIASALGNLFYTMATRITDGALLAPLVYVQLVSATILGIAVFGDWPDGWSLMGLALLLGSGFGAFLLRRPAQETGGAG
jgi:drug/metabolite transporter (DMT)-like permease